MLAAWLGGVAPDGVLVVEEVDAIDTDDEVFRAYLEITRGLMASRGGDLYCGPALAVMARDAGGHVRHDASVAVEPATGEIATIFGLNLGTWRSDPWVVAHHDARALDALAAALAARRPRSDRGVIRWRLRRLVAGRRGR